MRGDSWRENSSWGVLATSDAMPISAGSRYHDELIATAVRAGGGCLLDRFPTEREHARRLRRCSAPPRRRARSGPHFPQERERRGSRRHPGFPQSCCSVTRQHA